MKIKSLILFVFATLLSGCMTPNQPMETRKYSPSNNVSADIVTITRVEKTQLDEETQGQHFRIYPEAYKYTIQDQMGRSFDIYEIAEAPDFKRGECVIRWWDRGNNTYPRLSKAGKNCSLLSDEPTTTKVATNQQFTKQLKRKAVLDSWLDFKESQLVRSWGVPDRSYESDGVRFIEYNYKETKVTNDYYNIYTNTYTCNTRWEINNSIIVGYKETGNSCY